MRKGTQKGTYRQKGNHQERELKWKWLEWEEKGLIIDWWKNGQITETDKIKRGHLELERISVGGRMEEVGGGTL